MPATTWMSKFTLGPRSKEHVKMTYSSLNSFGVDPIVYRKCIAVWESIIFDVLGGESERSNWTEWFENGLRSDDSIDEDAPISSLIHLDTGRGFSIQQLPIVRGEIGFYCHLRYYGQGRMDTPIEHVHIGCELTEANVETVKGILMRWVDPHTSFLDMKEYLDEIGVEGSRELQL